MKMLFWLGIGFDRHGPSVHLLKSIIEEALEKGHEAIIIARNTEGPNADIPLDLQKYKNLYFEIIEDHVQKKGRLIQRYFEDIFYFFRCKKILRKYQDADVVFLQSCTAPIFPIYLAQKIIKCPVLFNVQNIFPIDALVLGKLSNHGVKGVAFRIFRRMQQIAYQKADWIVTISDDMKTTLIEEKVPSHKIDVIYNWSYDDQANNIVDEENLFLLDHPEIRNKFRVVFAGNLGAMVNAKLIADVAKCLKNNNQIQFIIIGDGNNMHYLKHEAKKNHLTNISFFPYQPEEYACHNYAMADININALPAGIIYTCMPSKTATMLNSARPMIISVEKASVYASILSKVDKCIVVDVDDTKSFAEGIVKLYHEGNRNKSKNAHHVFKEICSCNNAKEYIRILENLSQMKDIKSV